MPGTGRLPLVALAALVLQAFAARAEFLVYDSYPGAGWESRIGKKLELADGARAQVPLEFNFFDQRFADAWVSEDGYLQFIKPDAYGGLPWSPSNFPVWDPAFGFIVAPFWSALDPAQGGVYFNTLGARPTRTYVVTWLDLGSSDNPEVTGPASFQAVLREATGEIEFNYRQVDVDNSWWVTGLNLGDGVAGLDATGEVAGGVSLGYRPNGFALGHVSPLVAREGERVTLDGSRSYLAGEAIEAFDWDFGTDEERSVDVSGRRVTTRYSREGVYTVSLTVVGAGGTERHDEARITVRGRAPMARIQVVTSPVQYTRALVLSAAPSSDDRGIRSYRWDFGDGTDGSGPWASHRYVTAGSFKVTLTVEDAAGQTSTAATTVRVAAAARPSTRLHAGGTGPGVVYERTGSGAWETISPPLGASVTGLAQLDGMLYAAVWEFEEEPDWWVTSRVYRRPLGAQGTEAWEPVGQELPYRVTALETFRGRLYVGTYDQGNAVQVFEPETNSWVTLFQTAAGVYSMKVIGDELYVGDYNTDNIYRFDGETFTTVMQTGGSCIWDLEGWNGSVFAAAYGNLYYLSEDGGATWGSGYSAVVVNGSQHMWALQTYQGRLYGGVDRGDPMQDAPEPKAALTVFDEDSRSFLPIVELPAASSRDGVLDLATDGVCLYLGLGGESQYFSPDPAEPVAGAVWEYCGANAVDISPPGGMGQGVGTLLTGLAVDGTPPAVESFTLSPSVLPKPHHKMVEIKPSFTATDPAGGALAFKLLTIGYKDFGGFSRTCYDGVEGLRCNSQAFRDINIDRQGRIWLRAERDGRGTGRVYTVTGVVLDEAGNASSPVSATVTVPRTR